MKFKVFSDFSFFNSLNKLMTSDKLSFKTNYRLKTIKESVVRELSRYEEMRKELVERFADKDDGGKVMRKDPNGPASFSVENEAIFKAKFAELQEVTFDLPGPKIKVSEIESVVGLTGNDLYNLSEIVEE